VWCFFDESFPPEGGVTAITACLMQEKAVRALDRVMFSARQDHFGREHAKSLTNELKGTELLSKNSFRMAKKYGSSRNHMVAADILNGCHVIHYQHPIRIFGCIIYGKESDLQRAVDATRLERPLVDMLRKVSISATQIKPNERVHIVFDEQLGVRADVAIRTRQFVAGVGLKNVSKYPLASVSNVSPGVQLADICTYILGRRAVGDIASMRWMSMLRRLEWHGRNNGHKSRGIVCYSRDGKGTERCRWRCHAHKKELASTGKAPI
jgi:hypothetical protein